MFYPYAKLTEFAQLWPTMEWVVQKVTGGGYYYILWALALLYCLLRRKNPPAANPRAAALPLLILVILLACPPLAYLLMSKVFAPPYYPRFVWCLMVEILLAYVGTDLVVRQKNTWRKGAVLCMVLLLIMASGQPLFAGRISFTGHFYQSSNRFKLMDETVAIADYLGQHHPGERGYFTESVNVEIRQYAADILMLAGRDSGYWLEQALNQKQWQETAGGLLQRWAQVSVLVLHHNQEHEQKLQHLGWTVETRIGAYDIYTKEMK